MNNVKQIFGIPIYVSKISPDGYNKTEIVDTIEKNYNVNKHRNNVYEHSDLHFSYRDWNNENYLPVNYSQLIPIYEKNISEYIKTIPTNKQCSFKWAIVSYNCMSRGQYMEPHVHGEECDFAAIHYLKFNPETHVSTIYNNPASWSYLGSTAEPVGRLMKNISNKELINSWIFSNWRLDVEEDSFVIVPAILQHYVPPLKSDELRMTIVMNVKLIFE